MPTRAAGAQGPAAHAFHQPGENVRDGVSSRAVIADFRDNTTFSQRHAVCGPDIDDPEMMRGYEGNAQVMADVATVIEQAQREGRDLATALRIARVTLAYVSGPEPEPDQARALEALDRQLRALSD
jgi:hypothetical protein